MTSELVLLMVISDISVVARWDAKASRQVKIWSLESCLSEDNSSTASSITRVWLVSSTSSVLDVDSKAMTSFSNLT